MQDVHTNFGWTDLNNTSAHDYLMPVVKQKLKELYGGEKITILDLGCGNGFVASRLAELGHKVIAVDASEDGVRIARAAYPHIRLHHLSLYDEKLLDTVQEKVDCIVSLEVIEHLFYPKKLFEQSHRLLKDHGHLIISTPYHGYLKNLALSLANGWDKHFTVEWDGGHIKFFSKKTLKYMSLDFGFINQTFVGAGRVPGLWKSMVMIAEKVRRNGDSL